jgi:hypothetical protein
MWCGTRQAELWVLTISPLETRGKNTWESSAFKKRLRAIRCVSFKNWFSVLFDGKNGNILQVFLHVILFLTSKQSKNKQCFFCLLLCSLYALALTAPLISNSPVLSLKS